MWSESLQEQTREFFRQYPFDFADPGYGRFQAQSFLTVCSLVVGLP